ncbi:hypothetical protein A1O1_02771 [Capronia coronata CBS 617.96]|uniref:Cytochrome P450 n=1 Tax=Capronia coronata CBS 617.96 TaxID=1182541 RepID=W9YNA5_9EURO|nr:uncharacterized protein A1O1_02771 [Capronia coronata CBS 617.96]EXJ94377.1 hypothetical protein A1O1_02771 [Capronia coronata CBS 617.96]
MAIAKSLQLDLFPKGFPSLMKADWALISGVAFLLMALLLLKLAYSTDIPKISGIPELPGAKPFIGHLHLHAGASGENDAMLWSRWGEKLNTDLLQVKLGNRRIVIANSFNMVRDLFVRNAAQTSARPRQYIFEHYIGYDIGSHSLDDNFKRQRMAGIKSVQPRQWPVYYPMLAREGFELVQTLAQDGEFGQKSLFVLELFRKVSMNLAFELTFAKRFARADDPWLQEYVANAKAITKVRGASNTWIDFVPLMRLLPGAKTDAEQGRIGSKNRDRMIAEVLVELQNKIAKGEEVDCIASSVLKDKDSALSLDQAVKCSMSMLQGGVETIPSHLFAGLGGLLSPKGLEMQERAYQAIREVYASDEEAIEKSFTEEKVPYVCAIYKEMLRYYTIVPFSLPREAMTDIKLKNRGGVDVVIPAGTYLYMNAEGGGHDPARFGPDAHEFNPARWLEKPEINGPGLPHYAYGTGSRACPAWQISNRIMYGLLMRMLIAFRLQPDEKAPPPPDYFTYGETPWGAVNVPKQFMVKFVPRDPERLKDMLGAEGQKYQ